MPSEYSKVTKSPFYSSFHLESSETCLGAEVTTARGLPDTALPTISSPSTTSNVPVSIPDRKYVILIQDIRYLPQ